MRRLTCPNETGLCGRVKPDYMAECNRINCPEVFGLRGHIIPD